MYSGLGLLSLKEPYSALGVWVDDDGGDDE